MENTTKEQPVVQSETKIVNLFEDMKQHEHDEVSYQKMKQVPQNNEDETSK